jgi:hypothetical protein
MTIHRLFGIALCFVVVSPVWADDAPSEIRIMPYLWGAGFDGTVGSSDGSNGRIDVSSAFGDLELGGIMLMADWRKGPWRVFGDWTYANVSSDASVPFGVVFSGAEATVRGHVLEAAVGHALYDRDGATADVFVGLRMIDVTVDLDLRQALLPQRRVSADDRWLDGVVGLRGEAPIGGHWRIGGYLDVGGGGSDATWQANGWLGYRFGWGHIVGGWRHLYVDYETPSFRLDAALSGPFLGAQFRF